MAIERVIDTNWVGLRNSGNAVLVIGANWCPDCRAYDIIVEAVDAKASRQRKGVRFGWAVLDDGSFDMRVEKVARDHDYTHDAKLASARAQAYHFGKEIPGTFLYRGGKLVHSFTGVQGNGTLRNAIEKHLGVKI